MAEDYLSLEMSSYIKGSATRTKVDKASNNELEGASMIIEICKNQIRYRTCIGKCHETVKNGGSEISIDHLIASQPADKETQTTPEVLDLNSELRRLGVNSNGKVPTYEILCTMRQNMKKNQATILHAKKITESNPELKAELKRQDYDIDKILGDLDQLSADVGKLILELNAVIECEQNRSILGIAPPEMDSNSELIREARQKFEKLFDELVYSLQMQNLNSEKLMEKIRKALPAYLLKEVAFDRLFPFYTEMNAIDNLLEARQSHPFDKSHKRQLEFCVENCKNHLFHIFRSIKVASPDRDSPFNFFTHLKKVFRESLEKPNTVFSSRQA